MTITPATSNYFKNNSQSAYSFKPLLLLNFRGNDSKLAECTTFRIKVQ